MLTITVGDLDRDVGPLQISGHGSTMTLTLEEANTLWDTLNAMPEINKKDQALVWRFMDILGREIDRAGG